MSDTEILELPFREALVSGDDIYFEYDLSKFPAADAEERARKRAEVARKVRDEVIRTKGLVWVKLTAGQRAGTIGTIQLDNNNCQIYMTRTHGDVINFETDLQHPIEVKDVPSRYSWKIEREEGHFAVYGQVQRKGGYGRYDQPKFVLNVDGRGEVQEFSYSDSFVDSARPSLLIGYNGPSVWEFNRKGVVADRGLTIKDRYGREVGKGDIIIASMRPSGTQTVGKVIKISPKKSITLRHIGAEKPITLVACREDQVILLDDELHRVLMFKKLQTL